MRILLNLIAAFMVVFLPVNPAFGQGSDYVVHVDRYTQANGMGGNHAYDCMQDSRGIMWVIREDGIDRFDGKEFKSFHFPQLKSGSDMKFIMEDNEHDLWIWPHDQTVFFLNIYTEKLRTSAEKFGAGFPQKVDWAIQCIDNSFLIQDDASNVIRYRRGEKPVPYFSAPGQLVAPLVEYENGTAWLEQNDRGKGGAMIAADKNGKEIIRIDYHTEHVFSKGVWGHDTIHYITKDSFFLATMKGIVLRRSLTSMFAGYTFPDPYNTGRFQKMAVEQDRGLVWAYFPYRVMVFDKSLRLLYEFDKKNFAFQSTDLYDIYLDNQNHTWLSTFDGLYNVNFKPNPFHGYLVQDPENTAPNKLKSTRKICKAADGNIYVLAAPQLYRISPDGKIKAVLNMPGAESSTVLSVDTDENGNLWFMNPGLYSFNVFTGKLTGFSQPQKNNWFIKNIDNQLWFGYPLTVVRVWNGNVYDERVFENVGGADRMDIYDFVKKNDREYWLAAENGLYLFDIEKGITAHYWEKGTGAFYLPVLNVRHIYIDKAGDYWLATKEGLLYWKIATGEYHLFDAAEGVKANCSAVLEDDYGCLWISSDYGLMQFDKKSKQVRTYLVTDGLPSDEFNRMSYFKDESTGDMYLGGLNGLVKFHPRDFRQQTTGAASGANLVLTECLLFSGKTNKEEDIRAAVLQENQITLNPGDLFLKIKFALTDYTRPAGIIYSYRIDGYNNNWHTGSENELLLSGLPYGKYTLRVKAVSPNGIPYEKEIQMPIRVWPPFYLQTWFLILTAFLSALAVARYIRRRTRLLTERTAILEEMVRERTDVIENQRKSLEQLYDSKSRLYANITHEFRTPLTLIIGPAEQAMKSAEEIEHPGIKKNLSYILQNSGQLLGLVNQMLDLNKLESGVMTPEYAQADMMAFLNLIVEKFRPYAVLRDISLSFHPGPDRLIMDFDAELTEKIINNLLSNAIKFTPPGGSIAVSANHTANQLTAEVKDSGSGIASEQLPFIFERYYQADNSPARRSEGTGIGLALVKELVDLLEGSIDAESTPGFETIFTLRLPIRHHAAIKGMSTSPVREMPVYPAPVKTVSDGFTDENGDSGKPAVIIIEDHPAMAGFIASCLAGPYAIRTYTESRQGLAAVQEYLPDLVICDLMMPELDGYELCAVLKTDERTSHIPVVFLSAVTEQAERLKRLNAGADAYISKPFKEEELQAVAAQLLHARNRLRDRYLALSSGAGTAIRENEPPAETLNQVDVEFINKTKAGILAHLEEAEFDGNQLARALGFSASQLHRKLTALTGLPAGRYIYRIRLESARDMLHRKDLTITDIAYQTGFSDPAYFTKMFTKTFGQSPRKYRSSVSLPPDSRSKS